MITQFNKYKSCLEIKTIYIVKQIFFTKTIYNMNSRDRWLPCSALENVRANLIFWYLKTNISTI